MSDVELQPLIAAVVAALDASDAEFAAMPFFVRPMVRAGFERRTGHSFAEWRRLLGRLAAHNDDEQRALLPTLAKLEAHFLGAPERARRGMGGGAGLAAIEARSRARAAAVRALIDRLGGR